MDNPPSVCTRGAAPGGGLRGGAGFPFRHVLLALLAGCAATAQDAPPGEPAASGPNGSPRGAPWNPPPLERAVSVRDGRSGTQISLSRLLDELADYDAVFLGETHTDETTHRVELAVYEGLLERRRGKVVLAMEMFERDVQAALDDYTAGRTDEATFLAASRPWSNYHTAYRPLIERARRAQLPVLASNFPAPLRRRLAVEGDGVLDVLRAEAQDQVPQRLEPNSEAYWRRVDNAVRGHLAMMGGSDQTPEQRLYSTQSLWDNSMGETCALALERYPGHAVLHVNGGFHSAYWEGTVQQLALRRPGTRVATVSILPSSNPAVSEVAGPAWADFVVYAEARATDRHEGRWSVYVPREVEYAFHLPEGATEDDPPPLLIWLNDDGLRAADGLALWRERLGSQCAIAVIEPPYRETREDLALGGRWYWTDSFSSDISALQTAIERTAAYLARHYAIDPERMCLAGEGTGATVAAAVSMLSRRLGLRAVAFGPARYTKVRDFALPLPELESAASRPGTLRLRVDDDAGRDFWSDELAQYEAVGVETALLEQGDDPWLDEWEQERTLRETLGLPVAPPPASEAAEGRRHIVAPPGRATFWARLHALDHLARTGQAVAVLAASPGPEQEAGSRELSLQVGPGSFTDERHPPRCPGPFGGTTVLVLPDALDAEARAAWLELEENDPLQAQSRFHRLRIATLAGERDLADVLRTLVEEGRRNVLIVPASFCADGPRMRQLQARTSGLEDQLTVHWRPGLGGLD